MTAQTDTEGPVTGPATGPATNVTVDVAGVPVLPGNEPLIASFHAFVADRLTDEGGGR